MQPAELQVCGQFCGLHQKSIEVHSSACSVHELKVCVHECLVHEPEIQVLECSVHEPECSVHELNLKFNL